MDREKEARLEQADRCRRAASQIERHLESAERLRTMTAQYESQAAQLEDQRKRIEAKRRFGRRGDNTTGTPSSQVMGDEHFSDPSRKDAYRQVRKMAFEGVD